MESSLSKFCCKTYRNRKLQLFQFQQKSFLGKLSDITVTALHKTRINLIKSKGYYFPASIWKIPDSNLLEIGTTVTYEWSSKNLDWLNPKDISKFGTKGVPKI